jgi:hypothetical protein
LGVEADTPEEVQEALEGRCLPHPARQHDQLRAAPGSSDGRWTGEDGGLRRHHARQPARGRRSRSYAAIDGRWRYHELMRGLLAKLSAIDSTAESAVRIIATFDEAIAHRASIDALVRVAAALAGCPAGISGGDRGPVRYNLLGHRLPPLGGTPSMEREYRIGDDVLGLVWIERPEASMPLDEILVERMSLAAGYVSERVRARTGGRRVETSSMQVLLDAHTSSVNRAWAARAAGFDPRQSVRVIAIASVVGAADTAALIAARLKRAVPANWTPVGNDAVVVTGEIARSDRLATGGTACRVAVGPLRPISRVHESLELAFVGLQFVTNGTGAQAVWCDDLGPRSLLASIPAADMLSDPDVRAILSISEAPADLNDLMILEAFCRSGTLRAAAADLHLHHSSVAHRLRHIEDVLGYSVSLPDGRYRAQLALELMHLSRNG